MKTETKSIHLAATVDTLQCRVEICDPNLQSNLKNDVAKLVTEYWCKAGAPAMQRKSWSEATFEVISDETVNYIKALEGILEDLQADPETSDELLDKIAQVLK